VAAVKSIRRLLLLGVLATSLWMPAAQTQAAAPTEPQLKAVFVFNFSHFVAWPAESFATPTEPFVIAVLGGDAIAAELEEAVRNEKVDAHPLVVRRLRTGEAIPACHILYIDRALGGQLEQILAQVKQRETLTVSDQQGAALRGGIIELANEKNKVKLVINTDTAHDAGLTISSNLLRLARIVRKGD
jgi:hypothetical protein